VSPVDSLGSSTAVVDLTTAPMQSSNNDLAARTGIAVCRTRWITLLKGHHDVKSRTLPLMLVGAVKDGALNGTAHSTTNRTNGTGLAMQAHMHPVQRQHSPTRTRTHPRDGVSVAVSSANSASSVSSHAAPAAPVTAAPQPAAPLTVSETVTLRPSLTQQATDSTAGSTAPSGTVGVKRKPAKSDDESDVDPVGGGSGTITLDLHVKEHFVKQLLGAASGFTLAGAGTGKIGTNREIDLKLQQALRAKLKSVTQKRTFGQNIIQGASPASPYTAGSNTAVPKVDAQGPASSVLRPAGQSPRSLQRVSSTGSASTAQASITPSPRGRTSLPFSPHSDAGRSPVLMLSPHRGPLIPINAPHSAGLTVVTEPVPHPMHPMHPMLQDAHASMMMYAWPPQHRYPSPEAPMIPSHPPSPTAVGIDASGMMFAMDPSAYHHHQHMLLQQHQVHSPSHGYPPMHPYPHLQHVGSNVSGYLHHHHHAQLQSFHPSTLVQHPIQPLLPPPLMPMTMMSYGPPVASSSSSSAAALPLSSPQHQYPPAGPPQAVQPMWITGPHPPPQMPAQQLCPPARMADDQAAPASEHSEQESQGSAADAAMDDRTLKQRQAEWIAARRRDRLTGAYQHAPQTPAQLLLAQQQEEWRAVRRKESQERLSKKRKSVPAGPASAPRVTAALPVPPPPPVHMGPDVTVKAELHTQG